ncbi:acyltransferase family protein [mine drainage metagenome]|uniref:Acyltransferase family protein n=1 Tax=mine drainage metagenome TaxID=410659 RepID=A0A1J5S9W9_9ZZZZ
MIGLRYYDTCEISGTWFRKYLKNRIARIYPMYLLITIATFIVAYYLNDSSVYNGFPYSFVLIVLNVFFLRGFFDDLKFTGLAQGWTLTVEECFYFLAPLFFVRIKKNKNALWQLPLFIISIGTILVLVFSHVNFYGFYSNFTFMFLYTFTGRCIEFFIGISLALIVLKQNGNAHKIKFPLFTILGIFGMMIGIGIMAIQPLTDKIHFGLQQPWGIFSNNVILPCGIASLFYGLIKEPTRLRNFLGSKLMVLLGKSSYIFYLIHIGFISTFVRNAVANNLEKLSDWFDAKNYDWLSEHIDSSVVKILLAFVLLNLISVALFKFIEEPVNHFIRRSSFLEKRPKLKSA